MELVNDRLKKEKLEKLSGNDFSLNGKIDILKFNHYRIIKGTSVGGDAPKELLRVYEYQRNKKQIHRPNKWPIYIAKTGHKWYPLESITEFLLNRIGCCLGLTMAESKLYSINGQIRFLSKLFRKDKHQVLEHGAELYWGYLGDKTFVEQVEQKQMARHFFTLSFTKETLDYIYPHQSDDIFLSLVKMLVFDAIIGNNDRHFYNWGVVKHLRGDHQPRFSPIYDTARALFWNRSDSQIKEIYNDKFRKEKMLYNYIKKSKPKIGIEKFSDCNHFDVVRLLNTNRFNETKDIVNTLINKANADKCRELIYDEFGSLLSKERLELIVNCLSLRFSLLEKEIQ